MTLVLICEALGISFKEYSESPGWYIDLRYGKYLEDLKHAKQKTTP